MNLRSTFSADYGNQKILLPYSYKKNGGRILFYLTLKLRLKIT